MRPFECCASLPAGDWLGSPVCFDHNGRKTTCLVVGQVDQSAGRSRYAGRHEAFLLTRRTNHHSSNGFRRLLRRSTRSSAKIHGIPTLQKLKGRGRIRWSRANLDKGRFRRAPISMRRRPSLTVKVSHAMRRVGWGNIRARGLNPGDRVRDFGREVPGAEPVLRCVQLRFNQRRVRQAANREPVLADIAVVRFCRGMILRRSVTR
jgi:hypothetical protein